MCFDRCHYDTSAVITHNIHYNIIKASYCVMWTTIYKYLKSFYYLFIIYLFSEISDCVIIVAIEVAFTLLDTQSYCAERVKEKTMWQ